MGSVISYGGGRSTIDIGEEDCENAQLKEEQCLVGKVCMERMIIKAIVATTMAKVWKFSKPTSFQEMGQNIILIIFETLRISNEWKGVALGIL